LILATGLDGTLLGGTEEDRRRLAGLFEADDRCQVVLLTDWNLEIIRRYLLDPLVPPPEYIVGDVGASVFSGRNLEPIQPLQDEIKRAWPGRETVERALEPFPFLERRDAPQERCCSFSVSDHYSITRELLQAVASLGCSAVLSAGRRLDVLPRGVSKGATLLRLIRLEKFDPQAVVVAGDSLDDLSMFETELKGVVVGNAETGLKQRAAAMDSVFVARSSGAGGLLEGLEHHGFLEKTEGWGMMRGGKKGLG
jgi:hydroxymethylpyrimidine pyrophosphatase-like HAD family hydrolase